MTELHAFSYGGGVQSTAALVLAATGRIDYRTFLFANVGDDSENPRTLDYVRDIAVDYGAAHDVEVVELVKLRRDGTPAPTLYAKLIDPTSRSVPIPARMSTTGAPGNRSCTADYKIRVIDRWLRDHGATADAPATVGIGISTDELERAHPGPNPKAPRQVRTYPLLDLGLDRAACAAVIQRAGLPVPDKSSCYFCPMHKREEWRRLKRDRPDLFDKAVELERLLNRRRAMLERDPVWFSSTLTPLDVATSPDGDQLGLDLGGSDCESGYCMT